MDEEDVASDLGLVVEVMLVSPPGREAAEAPEVLEVPELTLPREAEVLLRVSARSTPGTPSGPRSRRSKTRDSGTTRTPSRTPATGATISQVKTPVLLATSWSKSDSLFRHWSLPLVS